MISFIPLEHVVDVLREPIIVAGGERYFVVAMAWTAEELDAIDVEDDAFGHRLVRIDSKGRGLPSECEVLIH